ncbi:MAG TPA: DUF2188 domain-containing protein [Gemmatimonadaceae bacterium]
MRRPRKGQRGGQRLGPNVWVVRRGPRFSVIEEGTGNYIVPPVPQRLAVTIARLIARANKSELIVQGRRGRIRLRDSHGVDPFPPRG